MNQDDKVLSERERIRHFLRMYIRAKRRKKMLENRLDKLRADMNCPLRGMNYSAPTSSGGVSMGAAALPEAAISIEEDIRIQIDHMNRCLETIAAVIKFFPELSEEREVLELRYIDELYPVDIAKTIYKSRSRVKDIERTAIEALLVNKAALAIVLDFEKTYLGNK